jgi:HK97 gp10 family phage protein
MADSGTTGLEGVADLVAKLEALSKLEDGKAIRRAVRAGMKPALSKARDRIPVGSVPHKSYDGKFLLLPGYARASLRIVTTLSTDKQKATALLSTRKPGFYAPTFVELGTVKMAARPWLRPAFYSTSDEQRQGINDSLAATIDKIAKGGQ